MTRYPLPTVSFESANGSVMSIMEPYGEPIIVAVTVGRDQTSIRLTEEQEKALRIFLILRSERRRVRK